MKSNIAVIFFGLVFSVFILITLAEAKETISKEGKKVDFEAEEVDSRSCKGEGKGELRIHPMITLSQVLGVLQFLAVYRFLFDFSSALLIYHLVILLLFYHTS